MRRGLPVPELGVESVGRLAVPHPPVGGDQRLGGQDRHSTVGPLQFDPGYVDQWLLVVFRCPAVDDLYFFAVESVLVDLADAYLRGPDELLRERFPDQLGTGFGGENVHVTRVLVDTFDRGGDAPEDAPGDSLGDPLFERRQHSTLGGREGHVTASDPVRIKPADRPVDVPGAGHYVFDTGYGAVTAESFAFPGGLSRRKPHWGVGIGGSLRRNTTYSATTFFTVDYSGSPMSDRLRTRRTWLATLAAVGAGGIAGCSGGDGSGDGDGLSTPDTDGSTDTGAAPETQGDGSDGGLSGPIDGYYARLYGPGRSGHKEGESGPTGETTVAWERKTSEYDLPEATTVGRRVGPAVANDALFFNFPEEPGVLAIDARDGSKRWYTERDVDSNQFVDEPRPAGYPVATDDAVHVVHRDGNLVSFDTASGEVVSSVQVFVEGAPDEPILHPAGDVVVTSEYADEEQLAAPPTLALSMPKGEVMWRTNEREYPREGHVRFPPKLRATRPVGDQVYQMLEVEDGLYVGRRNLGDGLISSVVRADPGLAGKDVRKRYEFLEVAIHDGVAYVTYRVEGGDSRGTFLSAVDDERTVWTYERSRFRGVTYTDHVCVSDDLVLLPDEPGLVALDPTDGSELWTREYSATPETGAAAITDEVVYLSSQYGLDPASGDVVFEIPEPDEGPGPGEPKPPIVVDGVMFTFPGNRLRAVVGA